jgi:acyl transferase domain-containing protein
MQQTPAGAMMAVSLPSEQLEKVLEGGVELAAINAPEVSVVSGPAAGVEDLQKRLQRQGVTCRRLRTSHGFHSALMEGAIGAFVEEVKKARLRKPEISFISSVTGRWIREHEAQDAAYWGRQMRSPVRFADGIREVLAERGTVLLEVGPGQELRGLVSRQAGQGELSLSSMPRSVQGNECETVMNALGSMWEAGVSIDWKGFHAGQKFRRVPLPTYPFERKRYWIEPGDSARAVALPQTATARNGSETAIASSLQSTRPPMRNPFIAPRDEVERIVVSVMEKILGIHPIGVTDHFGELGGDSLAAVSVVEEINARLQCELRAVDFYERSTAREAALSIAMSKGHRADALQSLENEEEENRLSSRRDQYRSRRRAIQQTKETKN